MPRPVTRAYWRCAGPRLCADPHRDATQPQGHCGRQAAGRVHLAARDRSAAELAQGPHGLGAAVPGVVDDDSIASGMSVRYVSDELEYIVFNFTDENLHHNRQDLAFILHRALDPRLGRDHRGRPPSRGRRAARHGHPALSPGQPHARSPLQHPRSTARTGLCAR
jgi:hypothetical protein